jgi:hypothetical protein
MKIGADRPGRGHAPPGRINRRRLHDEPVAVADVDDRAGDRFSAACERHARLRPPAAPDVQFALVGAGHGQVLCRPVDLPVRSGLGRRDAWTTQQSTARPQTFFENFQMPLLPPEIDEQSLLESLGSR